jgi:hypothetical protein
VSRLRFALVIAIATIIGDAAHAQSLRGSAASVDRMFTRAVRNDLDFLSTSKSLYHAVRDGDLVMLSVTEDLMLDDVAYPFVLPKTRDVVNTFARKYHEACGERVTVTSAARPRTEQPRNASPKSVHPTGMAVDFRKPAGQCLTWMRKELVLLERQGVLEATEEKHPVHFHVAVLQRGAFAPPATATVASSAPTSPAVATATADGIVVTDDSAWVPGPTANPASARLPVILQTPAAAPSTSRTAATAKPSPAQPSTYTVRKGDNLSKIAQKLGITAARLRSLNHLKGSAIQPGQKLRVK